MGTFRLGYDHACEKIKKLRMLIFDVDGVMTNGDLIYGSDGTEYKHFSVQDGMGISLARQAGLKTAIITARQSEIVSRRATELKVDAYYQGNNDKAPAFDKILHEFDLTADQVSYMGDDLLDLVLLRRAGFAAAPANAQPEIMDVADYVCSASGGNGAVREFVKVVLQVQNTWEQLLKKY
jgi:3-deoxy-D-manno-octulosonate 8-phosphate phosphatase (KDO 8-P phosphatase)